MEENTYYFNNLNNIKESCEKLITETQHDIEIFRNEQRYLQKQIQDIADENTLIHSKLEVLKSDTNNIASSVIRPDGESRDDATREKFINEAFYLKKIIENFKAENNDLRTLNKNFENNIENLKNEIQHYRNQLFKPTSICEVKQKYDTTIKLLENSIRHKNAEFKEQSQTIQDLFEQNKQLSNRVEKMEKLLEEKSEELKKFAKNSEAISKLQEQLKDTERHNKELQKSLKLCRQAIEKRINREQSALQKVEEALKIAEAAVADKEEALKREKIVKEECDNIASTIGQVMDEAARKVESDMEAIRNKYIEQEKLLNEENKKLSDELQSQKNLLQIWDTRSKRFQQKYMNAMRDNNYLSDQLEQAAKALNCLEEKIKKLDQNNEENLQQSSVDRDDKIAQFVQENKNLRERYLTTISDLTTKFEDKIQSLQNKIVRIKAENQALKFQKDI